MHEQDLPYVLLPLTPKYCTDGYVTSTCCAGIRAGIHMNTHIRRAFWHPHYRTYPQSMLACEPVSTWPTYPQSVLACELAFTWACWHESRYPHECTYPQSGLLWELTSTGPHISAVCVQSIFCLSQQSASSKENKTLKKTHVRSAYNKYLF